MNKFVTAIAFASVAVFGALNANAAESDVAQRAQREPAPAWQRAADAPQNYTTQINAEPGRAGNSFRAVTPAELQAVQVPQTGTAFNHFATLTKSEIPAACSNLSAAIKSGNSRDYSHTYQTFCTVGPTSL